MLALAAVIVIGEIERVVSSFLHFLGGRAGAVSLSLPEPLEVSLYGCTKRMHPSHGDTIEHWRNIKRHCLLTC